VISSIYTRTHDGSSQWLSVGLIAELIRFVTEGSNSYGLKEIKKLKLERRGERINY
jgi:hypothetical protein